METLRSQEEACSRGLRILSPLYRQKSLGPKEGKNFSGSHGKAAAVMQYIVVNETKVKVAMWKLKMGYLTVLCLSPLPLLFLSLEC